MADRVRQVNYCYVKVNARPGQGAAVLDELRKAGVNLLAFSGFPTTGGKAQLDLVGDDMAAIRRVARKNGWRLSKAKKAFLIQGPLNFTLTLKQKQIRKMVRHFAKAELAPIANEIDEAGRFPWEVLEKMGPLNFFGMQAPRQYGGAEMDSISYCLVIEEISRVCGSKRSRTRRLRRIFSVSFA